MSGAIACGKTKKGRVGFRGPVFLPERRSEMEMEGESGRAVELG